MPSKTLKQRKAMRAACHDAETRQKMKIDQKTACEFMRADQRAAGKKKKDSPKRRKT